MGIAIKSIKNGEIEFNPVIEPVSYSVKKADIYSDSTGRSAETGVLIAYLIRKNVYTIQLEYYGNDSQISKIETMINSAVLDVTFWDNGNYVTKTMYPSDREKTVNSLTSSRNGRYTLSFSLIEY
nr:MAG TPA: hypothetical protein [Caudoviricetes sp.]